MIVILTILKDHFIPRIFIFSLLVHTQKSQNTFNEHIIKKIIPLKNLKLYMYMVCIICEIEKLFNGLNLTFNLYSCLYYL